MILISDEMKKKIYKKIESGNYYVWLTEYTKKSGQHIIIYPSDKLLKTNKNFKKEIIPVRLPYIPKPGKKQNNVKFDKRSGSGIKKGRFTTINQPLMNILKIKSKS